MSNQTQLIYMADDHHLVAQGVANLLFDLGYTNVKIYSSGKELFKACLSKKPNFVFLDIYMADWDGIHTLSELKAKGFTFPCIMLSMVAEKKIIENCIEKGASAYIHKSCDKNELEEAFEHIAKNKVYISQNLNSTKKILKVQQDQTPLHLTEPLTERENEILGLFCDGLDLQEVANNLHLSHHTVETHKKHMLLKFQVRSISKMIALAYKHKMF